MSWLEAALLGILQGLTEFLPISSSGHLELGKVLMEIKNADDTTFTVVAHAGTALSTIIVFWKSIKELVFSPFGSWKSEQFNYLMLVILAAIPVVIVGLFFKDEIDAFFNGNLVLVGGSLLGTSGLLAFAAKAKNGEGRPNGVSAVVVGIAQAIAVLPGVSRSGATISTALLLGMKREEAARFSFLIVLIPILGVVALDSYKLASGKEAYSGVSFEALAVGFAASFLVGLLACQIMIRIVKRGGLMPFALYCLVVGATALYFGLNG